MIQGPLAVLKSMPPSHFDCLSCNSQISFTIDGFDRLIDANEAYVRSLQPFGIDDRLQLIGRSLWDFMPGKVPRQLWQVLQRRVRAIGAPVFFPLRNDSASERSLVDVELHALGNDDIRCVQQPMWQQRRPAIALLDANYPRDARALVRCYWCARVQVRLGLWLEIEPAQQLLGLAATATLPRIHDSACLSCKQSILNIFPARAA